MTTNAIFPAILGFSKGWYYLRYRKRVPGNSRDVLLVFSPHSPLFKNTRGLSFSLVSFLLSSISTFQGFVFVNPTFELTLSFCFSGFLFFAPLLFFVSASFLPTSFLPSPSPILLAFIFGRFALLFFLCSRYFFQAWRFLLVFFLLVFVWFASDCCCHHFFSLFFFS